MTTVAFDGRLIAADSYCSGLGRGFPFAKILVRKRRGKTIALAGAGAAAGLAPAMEWFLRDGPAREFDAFDVTLLGVERDEKTQTTEAFLIEPGGFKLIVPAPVAIGSGGSFAVGALRAGSNAEEAVRIASAEDPHTNADIASFDTVRGQWKRAYKTATSDRLDSTLDRARGPAKKRYKK